MMLIEHDRIEAEFLSVDRFVDVLVVVACADFWIIKSVGHAKKTTVADYFFFRDVAIGTFGKIHHVHGSSPSGARRRLLTLRLCSGLLSLPLVSAHRLH